MKLRVIAAFAAAACLCDSSSAAFYGEHLLNGAYRCVAGVRDSGSYTEMDCTFEDDVVFLKPSEGVQIVGQMDTEYLPDDGSEVFVKVKDSKDWQFTFVEPDEFIDNTYVVLPAGPAHRG